MIYTQTMHNNYIISSKLKKKVSKIVPHYIMLAQFNHVLENVCRHMLCAHVLLLSQMSIRLSPTLSIRGTGVGGDAWGK